MKPSELPGRWEQDAQERVTAREYRMRLPVQDAARIAALAEMYPRVGEERIITDLLSAALDELAAALPYRQGERVIREDDQGDPIYEDVGPTPRFQRLTQYYTRLLEEDAEAR